jgi:hypothetical protein
VVCLGPRDPGKIVGPRPLSDVGARPLNFTVRFPVNPYHYVASLRLRHPSLDLAEATVRFCLTPRHCWKGGTPRTTPAGDAPPAMYPNSYWTAPLLGGAKVLSTDVTLEDSLAGVLIQVAPHREFLAGIRDSGGSCECFVGLFASANFGIELSADLMRGFSDMGLNLAIDAYP